MLTQTLRVLQKSPNSFKMGEQRCHTLFVIFSVVVLCIELGFSHASTTTVRCHEAERNALMELKRGLSDPFHRLSSWVGEDCCNNWEGVGCSNITGHVIKLDLRNRDLDPSAGCYLDEAGLVSGCREALIGDLSPSLRSLRHLSYLDLSGNDFENRGIPQLLVSFEELMYLNLSHSDFEGEVPHQLGNLSTLQHLDLSHNGLYLKDAGWISRLISLRSFYMNEVNFKEASNWLQALNAVPQIQKVQMVACRLSTIPQSLPHLNFTSLTVLDLSYNNLKSSAPDWLFSISSLEYLDLEGNKMDWRLPSSIGNLTALRLLKLSGNTFSGGLRQAVLSNLCNLQILGLSSAFVDEVLSNLESVFSGCLKFSLEELDLSSNILRGFLPDWLGKIKNLKYLDLSNNFLQVSNTVPNLLSSFCQTKNLQVLRLANNNLSGELPNCWNSSSDLIILDLSSNSFYGGILSTLCTLPNLQGLHLGRNNLSGQFPSDLKNCTSLILLDLSHNDFTGKIPHWISESLLFLRVLILRSNGFSGGIRQLPHFAFLQILDLSCNYFAGPIPQDFGNLNGLKDILQKNAHSYKNGLIDYVQLFIRGQFVLYGYRFLPLVKLIDLSNNHLSGKIPQELWDLDRILSLNLSKNYLIGQIPTDIGRLKFLEALDLSRNNLSGEIPLSLADLMSLYRLDLSYNNLDGKIPSGSRLETFDSTSYLGNPNLYGPPLPYVYPDGATRIHNEGIKRENKTSWKYGSMAIGFGFGILATCGIYLLQRKWSIAYMT